MRTPMLLLSFILTATLLRGEEPKPLQRPLSSSSKLQHLLVAAEHLRSAGLVAEADRITAEAEKLRWEATTSLARKREQAAAIQAEVRELEQDLGQVKRIVIKARAIEYDERDFRRLAGLSKDDPWISATSEDQKQQLQLVQKLIDRQLARVVAEADLMTTDGRAVTMHSGGEVQIAAVGADSQWTTKPQKVGIRIEALPVSYDANRLKLDIAFEQSAIDPHGTLLVNGQSVPYGTSRRGVNTGVEMNFGETMILGGMGLRRSRPAATPFEQVIGRAKAAAILLVSGEAAEVMNDEPEEVHLMLVTPEIVQADAAAR
jgi:hypothetical protein